MSLVSKQFLLECIADFVDQTTDAMNFEHALSVITSAANNILT